MSLNIKNNEVEELARQVATATGETMTEAIRRALLERRDRLALKGVESTLSGMQQALMEIHAGRRFSPVTKDEWDRLND